MALIETFDNPHPNRKYLITHINPEFTSLCPKTGHPDFGKITVRYIPDKLCLELKSLKLYFQEYRTKGIFYEDITNVILDDLVESCQPFEMEIISEWSTRGGMYSNIQVVYSRDDEKE